MMTSESLKPNIKQGSPTMPQGIEPSALGEQRLALHIRLWGQMSHGTRLHWEEVEIAPLEP